MKLFHKSTIILTAGLLCLSGNAETPVITPKGSLKIEDLTLSIRCFKPKSWVSSSQESPYFLVKKQKSKTMNTSWKAYSRYRSCRKPLSLKHSNKTRSIFGNIARKSILKKPPNWLKSDSAPQCRSKHIAAENSL